MLQIETENSQLLTANEQPFPPSTLFIALHIQWAKKITFRPEAGQEFPHNDQIRNFLVPMQNTEYQNTVEQR